jgi:hypothetical protein
VLAGWFEVNSELSPCLGNGGIEKSRVLICGSRSNEGFAVVRLTMPSSMSIVVCMGGFWGLFPVGSVAFCGSGYIDLCSA